MPRADMATTRTVSLTGYVKVVDVHVSASRRSNGNSDLWKTKIVNVSESTYSSLTRVLRS